MTAEEKAEATRHVILRMEAALGENSDDMAAHFHEDFRWMGNRGCGTKPDLRSFRENWQLPLRAAFTERHYKTERFICEGDWASCFGHIEATHSGEFMGISATGKRVTIPYMDFWKVEDGRIRDNWVSVDFAAVLAQLGRDVFAGEGWEAYDRGERTPPRPQ
ncbi:ester cyclase [Paracoccus sediminicola]|uniref:ester cyclase n=1 Tax=Paracoccus sediminicola TaxID=3017783 RepID=UPI0022F01E9B|nr:ester cyclase [Paracoccus sediminicola]WBU55709.1 ester cyclase [Paracoccus sediminicola]